jgi:tetratricopeptide (TPR) repeat protein
VFGVDGVENARLLTALADLDEAEGDPTSALARLRRAAALRERIYAAEHPERAQESIHLAGLLMTTGDLDGAGRLLDANVDLFASSFVDTHPLVIDFTQVRAELALRRGEYEEAARLIGIAVASSRGLGRETSDVGEWLLAAASAEVERGRIDAARVYVDAAIARYDELTPPMQAELDRVRAAIEVRAPA